MKRYMSFPFSFLVPPPPSPPDPPILPFLDLQFSIPPRQPPIPTSLPALLRLFLDPHPFPSYYSPSSSSLQPSSGIIIIHGIFSFSGVKMLGPLSHGLFTTDAAGVRLKQIGNKGSADSILSPPHYRAHSPPPMSG